MSMVYRKEGKENDIPGEAFMIRVLEPNERGGSRHKRKKLEKENLIKGIKKLNVDVNLSL
jgi:hypothetical protein